MDDLDDVNRNLEQHALRNVRALVDKLERQEREGHPESQSLLLVLMIVFALVFGVPAIAFFVIPMTQAPTRPEVTSHDAVRFARYIDAMQKQIAGAVNGSRRIWPSDGDVELVIRVRSNGRLAGVRVSQSSGNREFDAEMMAAVSAAGQFPAFSAFSIDDVDVFETSQRFKVGRAPKT